MSKRLIIDLNQQKYMEIRKLQLIGGSSYMVSLPKSWIDANSLKKGDELVLHVDAKYIRIHPKNTRHVLRGKIKLRRCDYSFLKRFIHSIYVQGLDEVILEGDFNNCSITRISDIARNLMGLEIIDAREDRVVLKCIAEANLAEIMNRFSQIVSNMFNLLKRGLKKKDSREFKDIVKLERDADRLYMLAVRKTNKMLKEFSCPTDWDELRFMLGMRTVSKHMEDIADLVYSFSTKVSSNPEGFSTYIPSVSEAKRLFENAYCAYVNSDVNLAEETINATEQLQKVASGEMLCISMQIRGIGEIAFNKAVREEMYVD